MHTLTAPPKPNSEKNPRVKHIIYLHGFRSSPKSFKARLLAQHLQQRFSMELICPELHISPKQAIHLIEAILEKNGATTAPPNQPARLNDALHTPDIALVGSSLGGFYATYLAEKYGCRCILLNPAITPWIDVQPYLGEQKLWHDERRIVVEMQHIRELESLAIPEITNPSRYCLIAATGDEIINYRQMLSHYRGAKIKLIEGSDHGLSDFAEHIEEVIQFAELER